MKRFWLVPLVLLAVLILSACGTTTAPDTERPADLENYVAIFEQGYFDNPENTSVDSMSISPRAGTVERAQVGDKLVFVASHKRGPLYVHVRVFDPDGYVVVEEGPFEDWNGLLARRYDLRYTVTKVGRYHLQMTATGHNGQPFGESPYNAYVDVSEKGSTTPPPPPSGGSCTSTKRATLDTPSSVARGERFDVRFYVPCGSDYVSLQVYDAAGYEIDKWTFSSSDLDRYEGREASYRLSHDRNETVLVQLIINGRYREQINRNVRVGSSGTTPPPPPSGSCSSSARATLDVPASVARGEHFDARFYVPCGSDYVSLQVYNSAGNEVDRWTFSSSDLDRYEGREASYRLSHSRDETLHVQLTVNGRYPSQINRNVRVGPGAGTPPPPGTANCPSGLDVGVRYGDFLYRDVVYIPKSGDNFRLVWSSSSQDFASGTYVQLVGPNGVDAFGSVERSGDRVVSPSTLEVGKYDFRFTGYHGDGRTACLRVVTIQVTY